MEVLSGKEVITVTENEAIDIIHDKIETCEFYFAENDLYPKWCEYEFLEALGIAITALKEIQQYRAIGTVEEITKIIKQGINNCYMAHKYGHPGHEEGMCAGLRTMNGDGEPVYKCKLCRLNYLFERSDNHDGK